MTLIQKIFSFFKLPRTEFPIPILILILVLTIIIAVYYQADNLRQQQYTSIKNFYYHIKDTELENYSKLAEQSIDHLLNSGKSDAVTKNEAKTILKGLSYGIDGYFFLFDLKGTFIMHPRQPEIVGRNLWGMTDDNGDPSIQNLISRALEGGGLVDYRWQKPSNRNTMLVSKRSYVTVLKNWGWVLGTGVYLDDIDAELKKLDEQASRNITRTLVLIVAIVFAVIFLVTWIWIKKARIEADAELAQSIVKAKEDEHSRIHDALHDNIKPNLTAINNTIGLGIYRLKKQHSIAENKFEEALSIVKKTYSDLTSITSILNPDDFVTLGLNTALRLCASGLNSETTKVEFSSTGGEADFPYSTQKALYLVAKEAIANATKCSTAKLISVTLDINGSSHPLVTLSIEDNGHGFDRRRVNSDPNRGSGLRNMERRIKEENGEFALQTTPKGTLIIASIPINKLT